MFIGETRETAFRPAYRTYDPSMPGGCRAGSLSWREEPPSPSRKRRNPKTIYTVYHVSIMSNFGSARATVPARSSPGRCLCVRASLGLCAGTRAIPRKGFTSTALTRARRGSRKRHSAARTSNDAIDGKDRLQLLRLLQKKANSDCDCERCGEECVRHAGAVSSIWLYWSGCLPRCRVTGHLCRGTI
jgi:hypothetical protein